MSKRFQNQVVFITGASSGIGEALAREFSKQGAQVALLARRAERLHKLREEIESTGGRALAIQADVTRDEDLHTAVQKTLQEYSKIDVVVANAGFAVSGAFTKLSLDHFKRQFDTNVYGAIRTIYAGLDPLKQSQGRLVLIGSVNGHIAVREVGPYVMSKFALRGLALTLQFELEPLGISVTHVSPGFIETEIRQVDNQGVFRENWKDPIPRWLQMSAPAAARRIVQSTHARKRELVLTPLGHTALFMNRFCPGVLRWMLARSV